MINSTIKTILRIYGLVLFIFLIFRIILFSTQLNAVVDESFITILKSFIMGVRFDVLISGYILFFPTVFLFILEILKINSTKINKVLFYILFILFSIAFSICASDIPYFIQFNERFSIGAFEWFDNIGFVFSMIIEEPQYIIILVPYLILEVVFFYFLKKIFNKHNTYSSLKYYVQILVAIVFLMLIFVGMRGRIEKKSTMRVGTAYFCDNAFLNKLGLNPIFTLMRSFIDANDKDNDKIHLMQKNVAFNKIKDYLHISQNISSSPIARKITYDTVCVNKPNVVVIIMESMSAAKMKRYGNKQNLTPFMDSLANNSVCFDNYYTAGKHTFNGIFSTLFSFPALYRQHTMKHIKEYDGIGETLLKLGYSTTYFTTHDSQFDNVEGFLRANCFQRVISQADYPRSEVKTTLGVPDDYMFRFSIPILNNLNKQEKPFFVTFMTTSDHGPYYIPEYFTPKAEHIRQQITQYADWSLSQFVKDAKKQDWFDNTIFVFTADHGTALNITYDIALNSFHSPLIFFAPKILQNKMYSKMSSQIDIYPTIMGLLQQDYINNTLGLDLFREERKYAIVNDDNKIGILDSTFLCIMKENGKKIELYKYQDKDKVNYIEKYKDKAKAMSEYAKTYMQVHQEMLISKITSVNPNTNK